MTLVTPAFQQALDPVHETQAIFRAMLTALSRPGQPVQLPHAAFGAPANPWVAAALLTLVDHETTLACVDEDATETFVRARTGARKAPLEAADFVLLEAAALSPAIARTVKRGSFAYPDDSATLLIDVAANSERWLYATSGPGIAGTRTTELPFAPALVDALQEVNAQYPCGVDVLSIDAQGQLVGLPRTTRIVSG
jgi:alpha-D-ribose 1-methylphosphonate 5-triphosphate synthase subunit PhnH